MRRAVLAPALAVAALAIAGCGGVRKEQGTRVVTGLIDATEIDVASKIPARVKELKIREGDRVTKGQALVVLESEEIEAKIAQVASGIQAAKARLTMARKGARVEERQQAQKATEAAQHQLDLATKMYDRLGKLVKEGSVPQATFDDVEFKFQAAQDQLSIAQARLHMVKEGARTEEIEALEALVRQAEGTLAEVESYGRERGQAAPVDGEIARIVLHEGELAATGYPILTIVTIDAPWASFAVREDLLKELKVGTRVTAEVPALGRTVEFEVYSIAAMGDFATWKATNAKDSFDLKTFEVKARPTAKIEGLRPGMTVRWTRG
jgi:HlyD family secretion protein